MTPNLDLRVLNEIAAAASATGDPSARAKRAVEMIREACGCYWAGIFEISGEEASAVAWTGTEAPAFLHFPLTRGITRDVVKSKKAELVNDVLKDSRYLVGYSNTRAEIVAAIIDGSGSVVGTLEADSDKANAFTPSDVQFLEQCAARLAPLFTKRGT